MQNSTLARLLIDKPIGLLYLDTTYCKPQHTFPEQQATQLALFFLGPYFSFQLFSGSFRFYGRDRQEGGSERTRLGLGLGLGLGEHQEGGSERTRFTT